MYGNKQIQNLYLIGIKIAINKNHVYLRSLINVYLILEVSTQNNNQLNNLVSTTQIRHNTSALLTLLVENVLFSVLHSQ